MLHSYKKNRKKINSFAEINVVGIFIFSYRLCLGESSSSLIFSGGSTVYLKYTLKNDQFTLMFSSHFTPWRVVGPGHEEHLGHDVDEDLLHPGGHAVGGRRSGIDTNVFFFYITRHIREHSHLKCMLSTPTVTQIDSVTKIMVKRRYFPRRGTASDVGGMISASRRKKTVSDSRIEMHKVT